MQGNAGEGKTTFALRLAAAYSTGRELPNMKPLPPFNVLYQTAEDGLGDTGKPRLMEAAADLDRVLVIEDVYKRQSLQSLRSRKSGKCGRKSKKPKRKRAAHTTGSIQGSTGRETLKSSGSMTA